MQNPEFDVTWFYNAASGESRWEKPEEYVTWEKQHKRWQKGKPVQS
jgi:hypothetical protein